MVRYLRTAFRRGTDRRDGGKPVGRLHQLRNRVAHNETLIELDLRARHRDLFAVARLLSAPLHDHIADCSLVPAVLDDRP